jgi:hypothetical protein
MLLTKENQHKVSKLSVAKGEARRRVDEVKYAGPGGGHRRKMVDDLEEHASAAEGRFERVRGKFGVINGMLIRSDDTHTHTYASCVLCTAAAGGDDHDDGGDGAGGDDDDRFEGADRKGGSCCTRTHERRRTMTSTTSAACPA